MKINLKFLLLLYVVLPQLVLGANGILRQRRSATRKCGDPQIASIQSHRTRRVVGGESFQRGDFPWMVALYKNVSNQAPEFLCAGTLVHGDTSSRVIIKVKFYGFLMIRILIILFMFMFM